MLHLPDAVPSGRSLRPDFCGERRNRHAPWYNICSADIIPYFPKKQRDNCYLFFSLRENCSWSGRSVFFLVISTSPRGVMSTRTVLTGSAARHWRSLLISSSFCAFSFISMKSTTMIPERFQSRSWTAISSAASRFVFRYVSEAVFLSVFFPVFTSITVIASVGSMTR